MAAGQYSESYSQIGDYKRHRAMILETAKHIMAEEVKVPVLIHNGKAISESLVILEYIEETWKQTPLLPKDPFQQANARFWAKFIDEKLYPSIVWGVFLKEGQEQEKGVLESLENLRHLEDEFRGKKFFGGETIGLADLALGWLAYYLDIFEDAAGLKQADEEKFPSLAAWKQEFANVPVVRQSWPDRGKIAEKLVAMRHNLMQPNSKSYTTGQCSESHSQAGDYKRHRAMILETAKHIMAEEVMVFRSLTSPFALRVIWALKLKGVEFEEIWEDLSNKSPLLLQYNPIYKKVPVLVHNGKAISESLVILEYIEETWKQTPLLPQDPYQRANARFWAKFIDEKQLYPSIRFGVLLKEGKEQEKGVLEFLENLQHVEDELRGKKFFGGETIGLADLALGWLAYYLDIFEEAAGLKLADEEKFPSLAAWKQEFANVPVVRQSWPDRGKVAERFVAMRKASLGKETPR
ncbi:unnamed protein product [Dovyalis caffra]|uniref:glutathione transferase n=1 Tax=Dovyalis caffra TaxID=77055 RepID=A0AAV1RUF9_9ROSI|nr:unnamed protein product [Dovyalis caffra]